MVGEACVGLFLDPGLGKTSITLAATRVLLGKKIVRGVLVIAPLRAVYNVWPSELAKWDAFADITHAIIHGSKKEREEALHGPQRHIYITNPENVPWLVEELADMPAKDWPFDVLVVDESTKFKHPSSQRFKAMRKIVGKFKRRYILTGTPTPNGLMDLFGQIYLLDCGNSLGRFISHYRSEYFYSTGFGGYTWVPRQTAMREITERIAPLVLRMRREDYLELPPLVNQYEWMELPPAARRHYTELENQFITELGEETIIAPSAAAAGMKCRQVLNGAIYTNMEHDWQVVHDVKMDALEELVEELSGQPLLVLYEFEHDRERILEKFKCGKIGGQSMAKDQKVIDMFNAGLLPMVVGHPASMGHALNLQGNCAHVCWFGLTWNFEFYDQAIQRVWRQGNDAPRVVVHHLCIKDSLDEVVVKTLESKERTQTSFMEGIRRLHG